jgi:hypothetical protein
LTWTQLEPTVPPGLNSRNEGDAIEGGPRKLQRSDPSTTNENQPPAPRYFHTATLIGEDWMVLYGGRNNDDVMNDVAILDLSAMRWIPVNTIHGSPIGRAGHTAW